MNFVQIGANIGNPDDKLYNHIMSGSLKGILVEPNPYAFQKLQETYKGINGLVFENAAISTYNGTIDIYTLKDDLVTLWCTLSIDFMKGFNRTEEQMVKVTVPCLTLTELFKKHNISEDVIDTLVIDTEGHDADIILSTDFSELNINNIIFEYMHTDGNQLRGERLLLVLRHLLSHGYREVKRTVEDIYMTKD